MRRSIVKAASTERTIISTPACQDSAILNRANNRLKKAGYSASRLAMPKGILPILNKNINTTNNMAASVRLFIERTAANNRPIANIFIIGFMLCIELVPLFERLSIKAKYNYITTFTYVFDPVLLILALP